MQLLINNTNCDDVRITDPKYESEVVLIEIRLWTDCTKAKYFTLGVDDVVN